MHWSLRPSRRDVLSLVVAVFTAVGCAASQAPEDEEEAPGEPVRSAPQESDEPPVWAEGPVGSDSRAPESNRANADAGRRSEEAPRTEEPEGEEDEASKEKPPRKPDVRDNLVGVFPNERITLDFRKTRISRVMRIFKVKAKINIVLAPEVKGRLTVSLEDAPIEKAFRAILNGANLTFERRKGVLVVQPRDGR